MEVNRLGVRSPLQWVGGKSAECEYLAGLLPAHSCYVEVFGGGGSVLLAKRQSEVEVYNDLNGELVNFFRVLKEQPDEFKTAWRWCLVSREEFYRLRDVDLSMLTPIQRAYRFLYLNRAGFAGEMSKPTFGVKARDQSELVLWLKRVQSWTDDLHERLRYVYIENLSWNELIERWDKSKPGPLGATFFLDPPYFDTREYATGTLTEDEHRKLSSVLDSLRGRFLLTINDHPLIRSLYDGCHILERKKQYSISKSAEARKEYSELIISNYPLPEQKQARLF